MAFSGIQTGDLGAGAGDDPRCKKCAQWQGSHRVVVVWCDDAEEVRGVGERCDDPEAHAGGGDNVRAGISEGGEAGATIAGGGGNQ